MSHKIIDLSIKMEKDMFIFPGNKSFQIRGPYSAVSGKYREFCYELSLTTQTGTHIQGQHYFLEDGKTIEKYLLERFEGDVILVDVMGVSNIDEVVLLSRLDSRVNMTDKVILLKTGFMDKIIKELQEGKLLDINQLMLLKPGLNLSGARFLAEMNPKILGIDSFGFEPPSSLDYEVNHYLCQQGVLLLEGLVNLKDVPNGAWLEAFPLPIPGVEGTPCRAIAKIIKE